MVSQETCRGIYKIGRLINMIGKKSLPPSVLRRAAAQKDGGRKRNSTKILVIVKQRDIIYNNLKVIIWEVQ